MTEKSKSDHIIEGYNPDEYLGGIREVEDAVRKTYRLGLTMDQTKEVFEIIKMSNKGTETAVRAVNRPFIDPKDIAEVASTDNILHRDLGGLERDLKNIFEIPDLTTGHKFNE